MAFILYKDKEHYLKKKTFLAICNLYLKLSCVYVAKKIKTTFFAISDRLELILISVYDIFTIYEKTCTWSF